MKIIMVSLVAALALTSGNLYARTLESCMTEDCVTYFQKFKKAARRGFISAEYNLAKFYYYGYGTEKNDQQALKYYRKAAVQGSKVAQYMTGLLYVTNQQIQDVEQGLYWLERAALNDHKDATFLLGKALAANAKHIDDYHISDIWLMKSFERKEPKLSSLIEELSAANKFNEKYYPLLYNKLIEQNMFIVNGELTNYQPTTYERITVTGSSLQSGFDTILASFRGRNSTTGSRIAGDCVMNASCQRKTLNEMKDSIYVSQK